MGLLRLSVENYVDDANWRWVLTDTGGNFLADHQVALDTGDTRYKALTDLPAYLKHYASPDQRAADEARLVADLGSFIGESVLGAAIGAKILAVAGTVTVNVIVPTAAENLLLLPLDIAHARRATARPADAKPLARQRVRLVYTVAGDQPPQSQAVGDRLRILALFSLPPAGNPLNLRRERQMLRKLVRNLAGRGRAVDLRVLQYGVTRDSLANILEDGKGWDVVHFSGHGMPGSLILEAADGRPDPISAEDIGDLLSLTAEKLKLVTLSACLSAAADIRQTLDRIGVTGSPPQRDLAAPIVAESDVPPDAPPDPQSPRAPTIARTLAGRLDCAVLAMRYAVEDEFATRLAQLVYEGMFDKDKTLPAAIAAAVETACNAAGTSAAAIATPALFGARAIDLKLTPSRVENFKPPLGLAFFEAGEPPHFVGRVGAMTRASAALAIDSPASGVLFHGMAGAGKTAAAVELAYHHAAVDRFARFVWFKAPEAGSDIATALRDLALALERQIDGLKMVHVVDNIDELKAWLPRLTEWLEQQAVLIVLDNLETLLTAEGAWRDARWALVIAALLRSGDLSRVVMTSRVRPAGLPVTVRIEPIHALPLAEAVLLMRELPNLRSLLSGSSSDRDLVRRALGLVQGHPKLIHLAEALAADRTKLLAQLDRAAATPGGELDSFFTDGTTRFDAEAFTATLRDWTCGIADTQDEAARLCFHYLCCVEEADRESGVLLPNWPDVWTRLERPAPAPDCGTLIDILEATGLVEKRLGDDGSGRFSVNIHPAVAEAGRAAADTGLRAATDLELALFWHNTFRRARADYGTALSAGPLITRAGLSAFPYFARRGDWANAGEMLERVVIVDSRPATIAAALPKIRATAAALADKGDAFRAQGRLVKVLRHAGQFKEAEAVARTLIASAVAIVDFDTAAVVCSELANLLRSSGRLTQALEQTEIMADYSRRAGVGPWTQLADRAWALPILNQMGKNAEVLKRASDMLVEAMHLPNTNRGNERAQPWNVKEGLLDCARSAALALQEWQQALDFSASNLASKAERGAPVLDIALARFNDYAPYLRLNRYPDAEELLTFCRTVADNENDVAFQSLIMSAWADYEDELGRKRSARGFEEAALRLKYITAEPSNIAVSHHNLAYYLSFDASEHDASVAHRMAALVVAILMEHGAIGGRVAQLRTALAETAPVGPAVLAADFATLSAIVEKTEGVRFRALVEQLGGGDPGAGDRVLDAIRSAVAALDAAPPTQ